MTCVNDTRFFAIQRGYVVRSLHNARFITIFFFIIGRNGNRWILKKKKKRN